MTGAFLTGQPLKVRLAEYSRFQSELVTELRDGAGRDGGYEGVKWRDVGSYGSRGGYNDIVPLTLVRRTGNELKDALADALDARPEVEREWLDGVTTGWEWKLESISIDLYDLGVGVVSSEYEVVAPVSLSARDSCRLVADLSRLRANPVTGIQSPISAAYEEVARDTVRAFSAAVGRCAGEARQEPWFTPVLTALPSATASVVSGTDREWGRLLWLHPVYILSAKPWMGSRRLDQLAAPFEPTFSKPVGYHHGLFVPGIDSSVIAMRGSDAGRQELPMKLTGLQWAYIALFMEMDRGLLATLDDDKWQTPESLSALEDDAERIFGIYMRVQEARARLDSALTDLGGAQLSIWNAIADVQKFDDLVGAVEEKVAVLQRVAERRVQEATAARSRRTGNVLSGLTALTVVTVAIALISSFVGERSDVIGHIELRIGVVSVAFLLAIVLYREAQREIARKRSRFDPRGAGWPLP